jgi:hypothetical protein
MAEVCFRGVYGRGGLFISGLKQESKERETSQDTSIMGMPPVTYPLL